MIQRNSSPASAPRSQAAVESVSSFDVYAAYRETFVKVYGPEHCPSREKWDAMCRAPRTVRKLSDNEFDDNQFSIENGDGAIF